MYNAATKNSVSVLHVNCVQEWLKLIVLVLEWVVHLVVTNNQVTVVKVGYLGYMNSWKSKQSVAGKMLKLLMWLGNSLHFSLQGY